MTLERSAVVRGGVVAAAVALPAALASAAVDTPERSNWVFVLVLVVLAAMGAGGYVAARRGSQAPIAHGMAAALAAYVPFLVVGIGERLVGSPESTIGAALVRWLANGLLFTTMAAVGALVASWRAQRGVGTRRREGAR